MTRSFRPALCLAIAIALGAAAPASAAALHDAALQRMLDQGRFDELARVAGARHDADAQAALALLDNEMADPALVERARNRAEACLRQFPQASSCQYALAVVLGNQAQSGGVLKGLGMLGRVRSAFIRALELDPSLFEARYALQVAYLVLPGVAGGSVEKARALEAEVHDSQPEVAKILRANLAAKGDRWDDAERELASVVLGRDESFHALVLAAWSGPVMRHFFKQKQHARLREHFASIAAALPQDAVPVYWMARVAADEGKHDEAVALYERCRGMTGSATVPVDYREAMSLMERGDNAGAKPLLQRFIAQRRGSASSIEDAAKRLREIG